MCGLVGMLGKFSYKHEKMMKHLLYFNTLRGPNSTGIAIVNEQDEIKIIRNVLPGTEFVELSYLASCMNFKNQLWLGHNRLATRGKISKINAHPFPIYAQKDSAIVFTGAHNGTLTNCLPNQRYFETDSEALLNLLFEKGPKETIKQCEGAWALTFFDQEKKKLFFLRNKERPLYFCYVKNPIIGHEDVMAWASEEWMLRVSAARCDLEIGTVNKQNPNGTIFTVEEDTLYEFPLIKDNKVISWSKGKKGGLAGKPYVPFVQHGTSSGAKRDDKLKPTSEWTGPGGIRKRWNDGLKTQEEYDEKLKEWVAMEWVNSGPGIVKEGWYRKATVKETLKGCVTDVKIVHVKGFEGEKLSLRATLEIFRTGCAWCQEPLIKGTSKMPAAPYAWLNPNSVVCRNCLKDEHSNIISLSKDVKFTKDDEPFLQEVKG